MGNFLPVEIITNILSRLLTESLLECSLVCKTWRTIIYNDKLFAHMHSRLIYDHDSVAAVSSGKASFVYLFITVKGHKLLKHMKYDDENRITPLKFEIANFMPVPDRNPDGIIGSCNGLICISVLSKNNDRIKGRIYICNPITREFVYLPKLTKKSRLGDYVVSGFGYHPSTNDYKVVRIYFRAASKEKPFFGRVYVYTLGSGKGWRNLEDITYRLRPSISSEILANGALHWLNKDGKIVKFDLADETFCVIPGPECIDDMWGWYMKNVDNACWEILWKFEIRVLGGCLCIIERGETEYSIWSFKKRDNLSKNKKKRKRMLPDDDNNGKQDIEQEHYKSSWSWEEKYFNWSTLADYEETSSVYPFAILKDNSKILFHDNELYYYRQDLAEYEYEAIAEHLPDYSVRYVKSCVSLKSLGEEEVKKMESSEGAQHLPRSDLDSDIESDLDSDIEFSASD